MASVITYLCLRCEFSLFISLRSLSAARAASYKQTNQILEMYIAFKQ